MLVKKRIALSARQHCAGPLMAHVGLNGTCRASFAFYKTSAEVNVFMDALSPAENYRSAFTSSPAQNWPRRAPPFRKGLTPAQIEETVFDWAAEEAVLAKEATNIAAQARQQAAFEAERLRWKEAGLDSFTPFEQAPTAETDLPQGCTGIESPVPGSLWKFLAEPCARVMAGNTVAIIESMKMEIAVTAPISGRLRNVNISPGRTVRASEVLAVMERE